MPFCVVFEYLHLRKVVIKCGMHIYTGIFSGNVILFPVVKRFENRSSDESIWKIGYDLANYRQHSTSQF